MKDILLALADQFRWKAYNVESNYYLEGRFRQAANDLESVVEFLKELEKDE